MTNTYQSLNQPIPTLSSQLTLYFTKSFPKLGCCIAYKTRLETTEDCEIIASVTLAGVKLFVTENRESINNPFVKGVFEEVNVSWRLKTPKIVNSEVAVNELFS